MPLWMPLSSSIWSPSRAASTASLTDRKLTRCRTASRAKAASCKAGDPDCRQEGEMPLSMAGVSPKTARTQTAVAAGLAVCASLATDVVCTLELSIRAGLDPSYLINAQPSSQHLSSVCHLRRRHPPVRCILTRTGLQKQIAAEDPQAAPRRSPAPRPPAQGAPATHLRRRCAPAGLASLSPVR